MKDVLRSLYRGMIVAMFYRGTPQWDSVAAQSDAFHHTVDMPSSVPRLHADFVLLVSSAARFAVLTGCACLLILTTGCGGATGTAQSNRPGNQDNQQDLGSRMATGMNAAMNAGQTFQQFEQMQRGMGSGGGGLPGGLGGGGSRSRGGLVHRRSGTGPAGGGGSILGNSGSAGQGGGMSLTDLFFTSPSDKSNTATDANVGDVHSNPFASASSKRDTMKSRDPAGSVGNSAR
ncbi:MAG: hypothetical protein AAFP90_03205 [Planctomycetota bacterium]